MHSIEVRNRTYPVFFQKGFKIFGPPVDWIDKIPSSSSELFINFIPKDTSEAFLINLFSRFGIIFQFRLKVDTLKLNHQGFGYLRYAIQLDASAAMEMANRNFLPSGDRLKVCKHLQSNCLTVGPIPNFISKNTVEKSFERIFPQMELLVLNRDLGNAYVHFENHDKAALGKENFHRQKLKLWNQDLAVAWSANKQKRELKSKKSFVVRGVKNERIRQALNHQINLLKIPRDAIKLDYTGNQVTVLLRNSSVASIIYHKLKYSTTEPEFSIRWAMNNPKCWTIENVSDFCAELRLICIANGWQIPVILFGKYFYKSGIQYGSVLLRNGNDDAIAFLMEVETTKVTDIQSTMCEVVVAVVHKTAAFPSENIVYKVTYSHAFQVCSLNNYVENGAATACRIGDWRSIHEMACTLQQLSMLSEEEILSKYKLSFLSSIPEIRQRQVLQNCVSVYPKYRNKPALPYNLNDTEIVLVLRDNISMVRLLSTTDFSNEADGNSISLNTKTKLWGFDCHAVTYVVSGSSYYYHPSQRINVEPVWVPGLTYSRSTKNFIM